jgi:hypothetical protein
VPGADCEEAACSSSGKPRKIAVNGVFQAQFRDAPAALCAAQNVLDSVAGAIKNTYEVDYDNEHEGDHCGHQRRSSGVSGDGAAV